MSTHTGKQFVDLKGLGEVVVGTGVESSTRRIFDLLAQNCGYERAPVMGPARAGDIPRSALDATRAREVWGWTPQVSLEDGIARTVDIDALVEVHDEHELAVAVETGATLVGVNPRDLVTFAVDQERAVRLGTLIPRHLVKIAESGVRGRHDAEALRAAGYDAVLVGEHLVTAADPAAALTDLLVG